MDESLQNIRDYNKDQSARNERDIKQAQLVDAITQSQQVQVRSMQMLVDYLDNHVSKTEVVNQLLEVGTPDAYKVVEAVNMLEQTVSDQEPADLSEITALLRSVLQETEKIPKSHNDIKIPEQVDNSDKLEKLESAIKAVDASIKAQKLVAEAPIVNVPEAVVNVDKPDLSPIEQEQKKTRTDLVKAIKGIVIPETDIKPLEKELKKLNKLFNEFVEYGTGSSGGGGGTANGLTDEQLRASPVPVEATIDTAGLATDMGQDEIIAAIEASVTTPFKPTDAYSIQAISDDGTYKYFFFEDKDLNYYVMRKTLATGFFGYTKGTGGFATVYVNSTTGPSGSPTWASYGTTF